MTIAKKIRAGIFSATFSCDCILQILEIIKALYNNPSLIDGNWFQCNMSLISSKFRFSETISKWVPQVLGQRKTLGSALQSGAIPLSTMVYADLYVKKVGTKSTSKICLSKCCIATSRGLRKSGLLPGIPSHSKTGTGSATSTIFKSL